jgi:uncharacterized membrane protein
MKRTAIVAAMGAIMTLAGMQGAFAAVASQISAAYNADTEMFHGKVRSGNAECQAGRMVKVFKQTANGRELQGMTSSNEHGGWKVEVMHAGGHYFAVTPKEKIMHTTCNRAKSDTVDVM